MAGGSAGGAPQGDDAGWLVGTLREAAEAWLEGVKSGAIRNRSGHPYKPSAIRGYEASLVLRVLPELGGLRLSEVRRVDLQDFADRLCADGLDPSTVRNTLMPLRAIFRRAVARGEVAVNPTTGLELPALEGARDRIASPAEAAELLAALPERDRTLWATAIYAGLRRGELLALRWEDVDLAGGVIHVERSWDAKEGVVGPEEPRGTADGPYTGCAPRLPRRAQAAVGPAFGLVFGDQPHAAVHPLEPPQACERSVAPGRPRADRAPRVPAHVRLAHDRRRREREGAERLHGPFVGDDHARPLRPPDARQRERGGGAARCLPCARGGRGSRASVNALPTSVTLGLPKEAVVAVHADGLTLYRLVRSDPPALRDFLPPSPELAAQRGWPELLRAGLSHFLRPGASRARPPARIVG